MCLAFPPPNIHQNPKWIFDPIICICVCACKWAHKLGSVSPSRAIWQESLWGLVDCKLVVVARVCVFPTGSRKKPGLKAARIYFVLTIWNKNRFWIGQLTPTPQPQRILQTSRLISKTEVGKNSYSYCCQSLINDIYFLPSHKTVYSSFKLHLPIDWKSVRPGSQRWNCCRRVLFVKVLLAALWQKQHICSTLFMARKDCSHTNWGVWVVYLQYSTVNKTIDNFSNT